MIIGSDSDGVTDISLNALKAFLHMKLESVMIEAKDPSTCIASFIFENNEIYNASGFSIGYGGRGPHGLYEAIKMFYPDDIEKDFWESNIPKLDYDICWEWTPKTGFIKFK